VSPAPILVGENKVTTTLHEKEVCFLLFLQQIFQPILSKWRRVPSFSPLMIGKSCGEGKQTALLVYFKVGTKLRSFLVENLALFGRQFALIWSKFILLFTVHI
jgi:hypothetical protein